MKKRSTLFGIVIISTVLLFAVAWTIRWRRPSNIRPTPSQIADMHPLLSRSTFSTTKKDPLINFGPLRSNLNGYFRDNSLTGSLYFEYIPTGVSVHIRGDEKKAAASLLKVPLSMEVYKAIEMGILRSDQQITLIADDLHDGFGNLYKVGAGYTLTVEQAVKIMLIDSDNTALQALSRTLGSALPSTESVFNYLDAASVEQLPDFSVLIGARGYTSILKCLYYSCYLTPEDSQRILQYLTETPFDTRLVAGVSDPTLKIAHKIGVFQETTQSDCGIVYHPTRPYILCVMIDGHNDANTDKYITELSATVYTYITNQ